MHAPRQRSTRVHCLAAGPASASPRRHQLSHPLRPAKLVAELGALSSGLPACMRLTLASCGILTAVPCGPGVSDLAKTTGPDTGMAHWQAPALPAADKPTKRLSAKSSLPHRPELMRKVMAQLIHFAATVDKSCSMVRAQGIIDVKLKVAFDNCHSHNIEGMASPPPQRNAAQSACRSRRSTAATSCRSLSTCTRSRRVGTAATTCRAAAAAETRPNSRLAFTRPFTAR